RPPAVVEALEQLLVVALLRGQVAAAEPLGRAVQLAQSAGLIDLRVDQDVLGGALFGIAGRGRHDRRTHAAGGTPVRAVVARALHHRAEQEHDPDDHEHERRDAEHQYLETARCTPRWRRPESVELRVATAAVRLGPLARGLLPGR